MHVLMGCAADAASYEAAPFEHGVLTYALLTGLKGPALRDREFVDVLKLFGFAQGEVKRISATQIPRVSSPGASANFDAGTLGDEDRGAIVLPAPRPFMLEPELRDEESGDALGLSDRLGLLLQQDFAYMGAVRMSGALVVRGSYRVESGRVKAIIFLYRDREKLGRAEVEGPAADLDALARALHARIKTMER